MLAAFQFARGVGSGVRFLRVLKIFDTVILLDGSSFKPSGRDGVTLKSLSLVKNAVTASSCRGWKSRGRV